MPAYAHHRNSRHATADAQSWAAEAVTNLHGWQAAVEELKRWPEYTEQPLRSLAHTAQGLGISRLYYKDESQRFGRELASFKALGAPYAVGSLLADAVEAETGVRPGSDELRNGAFRSITDPSSITHVLVGAGVGSIAAAMFLGIYERVAPAMPRFVVVEPTEADCLYRSAVAGHPVPSDGSLHTIMAGLACREVSPAAWAVLDWLASDFVTIPDEWAAEAMRALAHGNGDTPVVCGESAAGGMAVLLHAAEDPTLRDLLGLEANSQVVLFGLEGATDPDIYERIVGIPATDVFARQHAR